jgi:TonB family protein
MFARTLVLILSVVPFAILAFAQTGDPPRPKVIATPEPKPQPKKTTRRYTPKTPEQLLAAFMPKVKSALAGRWGAAITARMTEFSPGNVSVNFALDAEGKVTAVAVTANTSNEPFAKFCDEFVRETKFEPPPSGVLADGQVQIPFTFTIY